MQATQPKTLVVAAMLAYRGMPGLLAVLAMEEVVAETETGTWPGLALVTIQQALVRPPH